MYAAIGKLMVRFTLYYIRSKYRRPIRIGVGFAAVGLGVAAYLASRDVPEG
jgi:hypothetical protein